MSPKRSSRASSQPSRVASPAGVAGDLLVLAGEGLEPSRVEVVAEEVVDEPLEDPVGALAGGRVSGVRENREVDPLRGTIAKMCGGRAVGGLDAQQWGTRSTWALAMTAIEVTTPSKGAVTVETIFIDSRTATGSPAVIVWPGSTRTWATRAGQPVRTTTPSSRVTTWAMPSTSMRKAAPCSMATTTCRRPPTEMRRSNSPSRSTATSIGGAVVDAGTCQGGAVDAEAVLNAR